MASSDPILTSLVIQIMPLMMREFNVKVDPELVFSDRKYADSVLNLAETAVNERLRRFSGQLRERLRQVAAMPPGAVRSAPFSLAGAQDIHASVEPSPEPLRGSGERKYVKTLR